MPIAKQLPSGSWRTRVYVGTSGGVRKYESFVAPTKEESELLAAQHKIQLKHQRVEASKPAEERMTVFDAITQYIESNRGVLSPTTVRRYLKDRDKFFPGIMQTRLCDLRQTDIQNAVSVDSKKYAAKSIHCAHGLLSSSLGVALPDFQLKTNLPQIPEPDVVVPEDDEIRKLLTRVAGTKMEVAILLGGCVGLRKSEICGLKVEDINVKLSTIKILRVIVKDDEGKWIVKPRPKTKKSKREIEIAPFIIQKMLALPRDGDFILGYVPDTISKNFIDLRNELKIDCRFHDLRHYNASIMLALGVPDKYAMERMGYSTSTTLKKVYQHIMTGKRKEVAATVNQHMNSKFEILTQQEPEQ